MVQSLKYHQISLGLQEMNFHKHRPDHHYLLCFELNGPVLFILPPPVLPSHLFYCFRNPVCRRHLLHKPLSAIYQSPLHFSLHRLLLPDHPSYEFPIFPPRGEAPLVSSRWLEFLNQPCDASACSFKPRAPTTLRIVSKLGLRSPESAL